MGRVVVDISMSVDGYITGPNPGPEHGLGVGGEDLHRWVFHSENSPDDRQFLEAADQHGAVIMGRRTFDFVDGPNGWDDEVSYAYDHDLPGRPPIFVVTHQAPESTRLTGFTFITDGIGAAVEAAQQTAGERDTVIMAGADVIDQALVAGLVNDLRVHLSPVLMGAGTKLFELVTSKVSLTQSDVVVTPYATHLTYRVT